eukprot:CAMPEP_0182441566 /NCGR_PEP_ID=MMETSP1172-20130603/539_1 /TAXON_ID=708627 /ORGANISM="Timspurckia oligopyrenoides, Strain CCMP3278" /LENGTH=258 /DNA_ID=CAMNT_0024635927 /DNA_START=123 /DNA_END=899 /DNA_ORIENTATION=+
MDEILGRIILVRHGERVDFVTPEWRKTAEFPSDSPLTERGLRQALEAGEFLNKMSQTTTPPIEHFFVSPYLRTLQTCTNILASFPDSFSAQLHPACCEWLYPDWGFPRINYYSIGTEEQPIGYLDAVEKVKLSATFPRIALSEKVKVVPTFPESELKVQERGSSFYKEELEPLLFERKDRKSVSVVLVSHGGIVESFTRAILSGCGEEYNAIGVSYCSVTELIHTGEMTSSGTRVWKLVKNAYKGHLSEPESDQVHYN